MEQLQSGSPNVHSGGHGALIRGAIVASLGGFLLGFDNVVISGTNDTLKAIFNLTDFWQGFTVAIAPLGTIAGALLIGRPADWFGRKKALFALAICYFVSAVGCFLARDWYELLAARFVGGLAIGGASVVAPMYIAEISPANLRGRLVTVSQLNLVVGVLIAFVSNYLIAQWVAADVAWQWMLGVAAVPSILFFALIFSIPESPRWLVKVRRSPDARRSLELLGRQDARGELAAIEASLADTSGAHPDRLLRRVYTRPMLLAAAMAVFNQLTGISAILFYAPSILSSAGDKPGVALLKSIAIGGTLLPFTIVAMFTIDRFGRRALMLVGSAGMIVCMSVAAFASQGGEGGTSPLLLPALVGHIAFFACSQGAVIWVFISEIFPNAVRAEGQAFGAFVHWVMVAVVAWVFPAMLHASVPLTFSVFAAAMVLQLLFAWFIMPETKGRALEDIEKRLTAAN